ncbi:MAG: P-loop NTPase fold protein, partial [Candidatus Brocadiales bacterium]
EKNKSLNLVYIGLFSPDAIMFNPGRLIVSWVAMERRTFTKDSELMNTLKAKGVMNNFMVVGLDGVYGAGKTTLAKNLAEKLSSEIIELDKFVARGQGGYVEYINYSSLKQAIDGARKQETSVIVDGVCLLKVLRRIDVKLDILIYVKQMRPDGSWLDEDELGLLNNKVGRKYSVKLLIHEIKEYHLEYAPIGRANYVFEHVIQD